MRFKKIMWILGLTAALSLAGGCSGNTAEESQQTQETEKTQDSADAGAGEGQEAESGTDETHPSDDSADQGEAVSDTPVRIYGTIQEVGEDTITVDNQSENSSTGDVILTIDPENTKIVDAQTGLPMQISDVQEGYFEAYLGPVMTMSIPPQTTPYVVVANIPEDGKAPLYAVAAKDVELIDGYYALEATDGATYMIPEDVDIQPYRTRNIVAPADITEGRGCMIWQDDQGEVTRVVLFEI